MHKYWGKKPSKNLHRLIEKYTNEHDVVLDPFSGYGVFCAEAYIMNRNVISNDLNPIAKFINAQLLEECIDIDLLKKQWEVIRNEFEPYNSRWYKWEHEGQTVELVTVLRDKENNLLMGKFKKEGDRRFPEINITPLQSEKYLEFESNEEIVDWYPSSDLILNSRISAKKGMKVSDLFTKRTLACHARLLKLIEQHSTGKEQNLLKLTFTANLANCSKLLPPIKSRGPMSAGAWMTGFYIGENYLENNVLHYFENRLSKIIKGKEDYLKSLSDNRKNYTRSDGKFSDYQLLQSDAKNLPLKDESIDYIFTDPPYGEAVPYFEQSVIWNTWLKFEPDYKNEIVISDSKTREKREKNFEKEINDAFSEIRRVLKKDKYFSLTYHSLSGIEWKAITNACLVNGFELVDYEWLVQKSFTPRQINTSKTIKGDVLVTLKKVDKADSLVKYSDQNIQDIFISNISKWIDNESIDTNEIFLKTMNLIFSEKIIIENVNLINVLVENFEFTEEKTWKKKL